MKRVIQLLLTIWVVLFCSANIFTQNPCPSPASPGDNNTPPGCTICDFPYNGTTYGGYSLSGSVASMSYPGCGGYTFTVQNDQFFVFIANEPTVTFTIDAFNCAGSGVTGSGLQALIFDITLTNALVCEDWCDFSSPYTANPPSFTLATGSLIQGQAYYLVVDGCGTALCDYNVQATGTQGGDFVTIQNPGDICIDDPTITLIANPPDGLNGTGTWSPSSIVNSNGEIDPGALGAGTYTVTYTFVNDWGCSDDENLTFVIAPPPTIDPIPDLCMGGGNYTPSADPTGGSWSGDVINPNTGEIDPDALGPGVYSVTYDIIAPCPGTSTVNFTVATPPAVAITPAGPICENANPITLSAVPFGGSWGGVVGSNYFDPEVHGPGFHTVTYDYNPSGGCPGSDAIVIEVLAAPFPEIIDPGPICEGDGEIGLSAIPPNGIWGGVANSLGIIDTDALGTGVHMVTYEFTNFDGCTGVTDLVIEISPLPQITIDPLPPFCQTDGAVTIDFSPQGGFWFGDVDNDAGIVDPATLGFGTFSGRYEYTDGLGCTNEDFIVFEILPGPGIFIFPIADMCQNGGLVQVDADPVGGDWGGVANSNGEIDPSTLSPGFHEVTYTATTADDCEDTQSVFFKIIDAPIIQFNNTGPFCLENTTQTIEADPTGGVWSGDVDATGSFNPVDLGTGTFEAIYFLSSGNCDALDTVLFSIVSPDAIVFGDSIFCQDVGVVNLSADPAGGMWSGANVSPTGEFNTTGLAIGMYPVTYNITVGNNCSATKTMNVDIRGVEANITGASSYCQTESIQTYMGTPMGGMWGGVANTDGEVNPSALTLGMHEITYTVTTTDGCMDITRFPIEVTLAPTAMLSGTGTICSTGNTSTDLTITLTGTGPWQIEYTLDATPQAPITINASPFTWSVSQAGTYELTSVADAAGCTNMATGTGMVTEQTPLSINNITPICDAQGTGYTFTFEISGGDPASYMVNGVTGTLTGNSFTSDFLGNTITASFTVSDNSGCGPVSDMLTIDCSCETMVGEMRDVLDLCGTETATASYDNSNEFLDSDDIVQYVLHTNAGVSLGNVIATNSTPNFDFVPPMQTEVTYYISAIAGNNVGGNVDLSDICTQIAPGTPVTWHEIPTATISGADNICPDAEATLTINFTGIAPWDIQYSDGNNTIDLNGVTDNPFEIKVNPNSTTSYQLTSITSTFCPGTVSGTANIMTVTSPQAEDVEIICNADKTAYMIVFNIVGGDATTYNVTGNSGTLSGTTFTSDPILLGNGYAFTITDAFDCNPFSISETDVFCNCETEAGSIAENQMEVCINETIQLTHNGDEFLDANDILTFVLHDGDANNLGNIILENTNPEFDYNSSLMPGRTYYISAVAGNGPPIDLSDRCLSVSLGVPIIFHDLPTVTMSADPAICLGTEAVVNFQLTGAAPFTLTFTDGTTLTDIENNDDFRQTITQDTEYIITKITDANGCENSGGNSITIEVNETPMATLTNGAICNIDRNGNVTVLNFSTLITTGDNTGSWEDLNNSGATGTFPDLDFSGVIPGNYEFEYTTGAAESPCQNVSYTTTIEVLDCSCPPIATAPAGPFCNDDATLDLSTITLTTEAGIWNITNNPNNSSARINNNQFDATNSPAGDYELTFTLDQDPGPDCQRTSSQTITISQAVTAGQSPGTLQICNDNSIINLFDELTGATPGGTWMDQSANATANFNDGVLNTQNLNPGIYTFTYEVTTNPPCTGDAQQITIEIEDPVEAGSLIENLSLCEGDEQTIDLFDLIENNDAGGIWRDLSIMPVNGLNNSTFSTANLTPNLYVFEYTLSTQGICPEDRIEVEVLLNSNPTAEAGAEEELNCDKRIANLGGQSTTGPNIIYSWSGNVDEPNQSTTTTTDEGTYILTVIDTVSNCSSTDEVMVIENSTPPILNANSVEITCFGDEDGGIKVENVEGGLPPYLYSLNGGPFSSDNEFSNLPAGTYNLEVEDAQGCKDMLSFTIDEPIELTVTLSTSLTGSSNLLLFGDSVQLSANVSAPFDSIQWSPAEAFEDCDPEVDPDGCLNPWVSPEILTTYQVFVVNEKGCADAASVTIGIEKDFQVYIPSAFSPNDDGINDFLRIYTDNNVEKIKAFQVFDRWGEVVFEYFDFEPNDPAAGWDGRLRGKRMDPNVFAFYAEIEFKDGFVKLFEGDVSLIK